MPNTFQEKSFYMLYCFQLSLHFIRYLRDSNLGLAPPPHKHFLLHPFSIQLYTGLSVIKTLFKNINNIQDRMSFVELLKTDNFYCNLTAQEQNLPLNPDLPPWLLSDCSSDSGTEEIDLDENTSPLPSAGYSIPSPPVPENDHIYSWLKKTHVPWWGLNYNNAPPESDQGSENDVQEQPPSESNSCSSLPLPFPAKKTPEPSPEPDHKVITLGDSPYESPMSLCYRYTVSPMPASRSVSPAASPSYSPTPPGDQSPIAVEYQYHNGNIENIQQPSAASSP